MTQAISPWLYAVVAMAATLLIGLFVRAAQDRPAWQRPVNQFFGGLNVAAALLLVFLTVCFITAIPIGQFFRYRGEFPLLAVAGAAVVFVLFLGFAWVRWGLVPHTIASDRVWKLGLGHLLILVGTVGYGSVTFYAPILASLGIIQWEDTAVLPWLAFFTLPLALLFWPIGLALILASREPRTHRGPSPVRRRTPDRTT